MTRLGSPRHTLPRSASLKRQRWIRALFDRSLDDRFSVSAGCIRIVFRFVHEPDRPERETVLVGFSAGGALRKAVERNRIKRLLRESYRVQQDILREVLPPSSLLTLMILYRRNSLASHEEIHHDLGNALRATAAKIGKAHQNG